MWDKLTRPGPTERVDQDNQSLSAKQSEELDGSPGFLEQSPDAGPRARGPTARSQMGSTAIDARILSTTSERERRVDGRRDVVAQRRRYREIAETPALARRDAQRGEV